MSDTNNSLPTQNSFEPGVGVNPEPAASQPTEPQGSFVIADLHQEQPAVAAASASDPESVAVSASSVPQMTVETIPEEPQPDAPAPLDSTMYQQQETVVIPTTQQPYVPESLMQATPAATPVGNIESPPPKQRSGVIKWIVLFMLMVLVVLGVIIGVRLGGQLLNRNQPVTLTYWGLWETEEVMRPVIAKFEADNPNIKVNYRRENYRQYRERLESAINRGEGPDLFRFHSTWIPMLKNQIEPVPEAIMSPEAFESLYHAVHVKDLLAKTTLWGIPMMFDGLGLYVNEELFSSAGVSVPRTYEDLMQVIPRLTVKNGNEIITSAIALGTTNNIDHFSDILGLMIVQNGGELAKPTGETREKVEEALVFYRKFATPSDQLYTWNELQDNAVAAFANGRLAMMIAPSWRAFDVQALNSTLRFRIEPVPQLPRSNASWASYWVEGVSSKSKNKEAAFTFLKYITSQEAVTQLYADAGRARLFGPPYALKSASESVAEDRFVGAYVLQAANAFSFPLASKTHDNGLNDQMIKYMEDAINAYAQGTAPSAALETMSQGFNQVLSRYGLVNNR